MELEKRWKDLAIKDKILYTMAIVLIMSGIIIAFICFLFTYTIVPGVLIYISEAFMSAGGIFGVSIYFKSKLGEYSNNTTQKIEEIIEKVLNREKIV